MSLSWFDWGLFLLFFAVVIGFSLFWLRRSGPSIHFVAAPGPITFTPHITAHIERPNPAP